MWWISSRREAARSSSPHPFWASSLYGFSKGSRPTYNEKKLYDFISALRVSIIDVTEEISRKYAVVYSALTAKGLRIPINDVWIAACCMGVGGTLVTRDRHFDRVDQIDKVVLPDEH